MASYTMYYPSGRLLKDGVEFPADETNQDYQDYVAWLTAGNGADLQPDPPAPPVTVSADQIARAMTQLGLAAATRDQLDMQVFPLAVTL